MRIEKVNGKFVIVRGDENRPQYFSFFVDFNRSSWTKYGEQAHKHETRTSAENTLERLRFRQRDRRETATRTKQLRAARA